MSSLPEKPLASQTLQFEEGWYDNRALDYVEAWQLQREIHAQRVADEIVDTALFLEHPPVYTAGKRTEPHERPADALLSSTSIAVARSPSTAPDNSSVIPSPNFPRTSWSWTMYGASRKP